MGPDARTLPTPRREDEQMSDGERDIVREIEADARAIAEAPCDCPRCGGSGYIAWGPVGVHWDSEPCGLCDETGEVSQAVADEFRRLAEGRGADGLSY